jgi:hypothetical protein
MKAFGEILPQAQKMTEATIFDSDGNEAEDAGPELIHSDNASDPLIVGSWGSYFQHRSHSNEILKEYIPPAKEALSNWTPSDVWVLPTDLPIAVLEWFQGQKHILFANEPISNFQDIATILMRVLGLQEIPQCDTPPLVWLFKQILSHQEQSLEGDTRASQKYWHSSFDGRHLHRMRWLEKIRFPRSGWDLI